MVLLISKMRRYYDAKTTDEVLAEFRPLLCPHDHMCNQAQGFLCLFLPSNNQCVEWLEECLSMWIWNDNNPYWDHNFFFLFRRLAQDSIGLINWTPHLHLIYTRILRSLDLPVGSASRAAYNRFPSQSCSVFTGNFNQCKSSLVEHCAHFIIWMMSPKCPDALDLLKKLFQSIESYYHPSNGGNWSGGLGLFLQALCKALARRALNEKSEDCKTPESYRLSNEQIQEFVNLVLPVAQTAMYGKSTRLAMSAVQAIKHLTYLTPSTVLPTIMERISEDLQTLTETHQTTAAMGLLSVIIFPMMKTREFNASAYIHDLMNFSLPGIDANDPFKTFITIRFFVGLLTVMPLFTKQTHDASKASNVDGIVFEEEDDHQNEPLAVQFFEDWAVELLNRIFRVLSTLTIDRKSSKSENAENNIPLRGLARLLFMQLSPQLHRLCVRKVVEYVHENFTPNADKFIGDICQSAASYVSGAPEDANYDPCGQLVDVFYHKLVTDSGELNHLTDSELSYYLYLLAKTVQINPSAMKHKDKLLTVLKVTYYNDEKKVIKPAGKLLKNLIQSLTSVYPLEYRSVKPSIWESEKFARKHWNYWGQFTGMDDIDISWHVPNQEELDFAAELYNQFIDTPISYLKSLPGEFNKHKVTANLMRLRYILRGCSLILPEMNENVEPNFTKNIASREVNTGTFEIPDSKFKYTRYQIAEVLHHTYESLTSEKHSADSEKANLDQTTILTLLIKNYYTIICFRAKTFSKTLDNSKAHEFTKRNLFKSFNEKQKYPRTFLVQRSHQILQSRVYMKTIPYTTLHSKMLDDLKVLSLSEYAKVRSKAQGVMVNSLKLFSSRAFNLFLPDVIRILSNPKSKNSAVNGAIYTLQRKTVIRKVTENWELLSLFLTSICQSHFIEKASIQNRLNNLFVSYSVSFKELKLKDYKNGTTIDHTPEYHQLIQDLLKILQDQNLHWRYELMLYTVLVLMIRSDKQILVPLDVAKVFFKSLVSDVVLLRTGSLKAASMVLTQYKPKQKLRLVHNESTEPIVLSPQIPITPITDADSWGKAVFHDKNYYGWNCQPKSLWVYDYEAQPDHDEHLDSLQKLLREIMYKDNWLSKFFEYSAAQPRMNRVSFSDMVAQSLKGIFQILGIEFLEKSKPHFEKLLLETGSGKPEERNALAFASEFIGALARGSKHWSFEDREKSFTYILPHLKQILTNCSQSCIPDYHAALRFCVYDLDVRRCMWLRDFLIQNLDLGSGTTSHQAKSIGYLFPVLSEFSWRDPCTNQKVCEKIFPFLDHPYQQVRQKIANTLTLNFRFMWRTSHAIEFNNRTPELEEVLMRMSEKLKESKLASNSDDPNSPAENLRKMVSSMIGSLIEMASNMSVVPYLDVIIPMLFDIYAETNDAELQANVRKTFLSISASLFPGEYVKPTLSLLATQKEHGNHKLRIQLAIFVFLQSFAYRHQFYLLEPSEEDLLFKMLEDGIRNENNEVEVRELASVTLGDFIRIASEKKVKEFLTHFKKVSHPPKKRRRVVKSQTTTDSSTATTTTTTTTQSYDPLYVVLGLSALVRSCPYEIPDWLPDILSRLASFNQYKAPKDSKINAQAVNETVKKTFAIFWALQRDKWHINKKKLTEEQLFEVTSLLVSPVYYV
jgi:proteasome activator subunit 4